METSTIPENIIRYRHDRGLSRAKLASKSGLSEGSLANLEKGKTTPRLDTLQKVAKGLDVRIKELLIPVKKLTAVRFRAQKKLKSRDQIRAKASRWLEDFNEVLDLLKVNNPSIPKLPPSIRRMPPSSRPINAARYARKLMSLKDDEPIHDLTGLLAAHGVKILPHSVASDAFFGMSVSESDGGPAIIINTFDRIPVERWIFSAAHELGHLLLHVNAYDIGICEEDPSEENEANLFASHLLMPQEGFVKEWNESCGLHSWQRILKVKRIFRVSYRAVIYRLVEMGVYKKTVWRDINSFLRRNLGYQPPKDFEPERLKPSDFREDWISRLVRKALEGGLITVSRASEILEMPVNEMRILAASWTGEHSGFEY